jgi:hypothetical protein
MGGDSGSLTSTTRGGGAGIASGTSGSVLAWTLKQPDIRNADRHTHMKAQAHVPHVCIRAFAHSRIS